MYYLKQSEPQEDGKLEFEVTGEGMVIVTFWPANNGDPIRFKPSEIESRSLATFISLVAPVPQKKAQKGKAPGVSDEKSRRRFNCFARHGCTDFWTARYATATMTQVILDLQERKDEPLNSTMRDKLIAVIADLNREINSL